MASNFNIRSHRRFAFQCYTYYMGTDVLGKGNVINLSTGGWEVDGDQSVPKDSFLTMLLYLPDHHSPIRVERAAVRWSRGQQFGLEILQMQPRDRGLLKEFIKSLVDRNSFPRPGL